MIAADDDGRFDLATLNQIIHGDAKLSAIAIAQPANARRQTLEMDSLLCQFQPARKSLVLWKKFERKLISPRDVGWIAAQRDPSKRTFSFAEERAAILQHEPSNIEYLFDAGLFRLRANVVPIIESNRAALLQREHRIDVHRHRSHRALNVLVRIFRAQLQRFREGHSVRDIAVERVM